MINITQEQLDSNLEKLNKVFDSIEDTFTRNQLSYYLRVDSRSCILVLALSKKYNPTEIFDLFQYVNQDVFRINGKLNPKITNMKMFGLFKDMLPILVSEAFLDFIHNSSSVEQVKDAINFKIFSLLSDEVKNRLTLMGIDASYIAHASLRPSHGYDLTSFPQTPLGIGKAFVHAEPETIDRFIDLFNQSRELHKGSIYAIK